MVGFEGFVVGDVLVANPALFLPEAVFRADAWVIKTGRDGVDALGLTVIVLKHVAEAAVEDAGLALGQARGVLAGFESPAASLGADELDLGVVNERIKDAGRVRA